MVEYYDNQPNTVEYGSPYSTLLAEPGKAAKAASANTISRDSAEPTVSEITVR